ncbi:hypothetical protein PEXP_015050 [Penicillium expansum]|nr:hypothetical protein PEXP_015050 [Penicillium expansum]
MSEYNLEVPASCPFHVRCLNQSMYLFREHDNYDQYPDIYAKICPTPSKNGKLRALGDRKNTEHGASDDPKAPAYWNIYTVLKHTINPDFVYSPSTSINVPTGITILHTPGHTPDSLTWYDKDSRLLYVGDSFYETKSEDTKECQLEGEMRAPILFEERSHLEPGGGAWTKSGPPPRVAISASHVTTTSPDAEPFLFSIRAFMSRILRGEVDTTPLDSGVLPFKDVMVYDDGPQAAASKDFEWIVWAPKRTTEEGVWEIPREELS